MSTASELLDAILAESDDDTAVGQYSMEDVLNDRSDFKVDSPATGQSSTTTAAESPVPPSTLAAPSNDAQAFAPTPTVSYQHQVALNAQQDPVASRIHASPVRSSHSPFLFVLECVLFTIRFDVKLF